MHPQNLPTSSNEALAQVRILLSSTPSKLSYTRLFQLLRFVELLAPRSLDENVLSYVKSHLKDWYQAFPLSTQQEEWSGSQYLPLVNDPFILTGDFYRAALFEHAPWSGLLRSLHCNLSELNDSDSLEQSKKWSPEHLFVSPLFEALEYIHFCGANHSTKTYNLFDSMLLSPYLKKVKMLRLSNGILRDDSIERLAQAPNFGPLEVLDLSECAQTDDLLDALACSPYLKNIRVLKVRASEVHTTEGIQNLLDSENCRTLEHLLIKTTHYFDLLDRPNQPLLIHSSNLPNLQKLEVDYLSNPLEDQKVEIAPTTLKKLKNLRLCDLALTSEQLSALASTPHFSALERLELDACQEPYFAKNSNQLNFGPLFNSRNYPSLEKLHIRSYRLTNPNSKAPTQDSLLAHLKELALWKSGVDDKTFRFFNKLSSPSALKKLILWDCYDFSSEGLFAFLSAPLNSQLRELSICETSENHSEFDFKRLVATGILHTLESLHIAVYYYNWGVTKSFVNAHELSNIHNSQSLRSLHLSGPGLQNDLKSLFQSHYLQKVEALNLYNCRFGSALKDGITHIHRLKNLRKLELGHNELGDKELSALIQALGQNHLEELSLDHNPSLNKQLVNLAKSPHFESLRVLSLKGIKLRKKALEALLESPTLQNLSLLRLPQEDELALTRTESDIYQQLRLRYAVE